MEFRKETDSLGEIDVRTDHLWGAQTERSLIHFPLTQTPMPKELIHALGIVKKAAAIVNQELGVLDYDKAALIIAAAEEVIEGKLDAHFPLSVWQTGSGTQTNMNANEVIANRCAEMEKKPLGKKSPIHPNDDVNKSQSSNDTFPTAMHIAAGVMVHTKLFPALEIFHKTLCEKIAAFKGIVKIGRTHMMDATPLTLAQEFAAFDEQIEQCKVAIERALEDVYKLALGGSAVGTGLNVPSEYPQRVARAISEATKLPFVTAPNKCESLATMDAIARLSSALKSLASALMKIGNDLRLLASGPRCGLGEIVLPANEPGSSIMPGKVNPTQIEALTMVAAQVIGNDLAISIGAMGGQLQLNVFRPMAIHNLLESIDLLSGVLFSFTTHCLKGTQPNREVIDQHLNNSLMLVTALNTHIGYDKAAMIAKKAYQDKSTLKQAATALGYLTSEEFDRIVRPEQMTNEKS